LRRVRAGCLFGRRTENTLLYTRIQIHTTIGEWLSISWMTELLKTNYMVVGLLL
jgi:hypothetical protein